MSGWRQVAGGLAITFVVIVIIGASLTTAIAEQRLLIEPLPPTRTSIPDLPAPSATADATSTPGTPDSLASATPSPTPPPPTSCLPPSTWLAYEVQEGDTLEALAAAAGAAASTIAEANCLALTALIPGSILYLPTLPATPTGTATPTATQTTGSPPSGTPVPCGPPSGWVQYTVQSGDTLFSLAQATNTTVPALQSANCLGSSTYIQAGAKIWLPFIPVQTPTKTLTPTRTPTPSPTSGATTPPAPSPTPTPTLTPSPTATTTPSPTQTPSPTATVTETRQPPTETGTATSAPSSLD